MKPIYVKWHDAVSDDAWIDKEDHHDLETHVIHTLGFLVHEDRSKIIVAMQWDPEREGISMRMAIPKSWIIKRRFLRVGIK